MSSLRAGFVIVLLAAGIAARADAQCTPEWLPGDGLPGLNGTVKSSLVWDDGTGPALYVGGSFTVAGNILANNIAKWNGTSWQALGSGVTATGRIRPFNPISPFHDVYALAAYNGQLIAGGSFTTAGGARANFIAAWNGVSWQPLGSGMNSIVHSLAVYNGQLIAGGDFTTAGGISANRIAAWNGSSWQPLGTAIAAGSIRALVVYDGCLVAGGGFDTAGGVGARNTAAWDGTTWRPLGTGPVESEFYGRVDALIVYDGQLIAAGSGTTFMAASWNGASWQAMNSGTYGAVCGLTIFNGQLLAGGRFSNDGWSSQYHIITWDGKSWQEFAEMGGYVYRQPQIVWMLTVYNGQLIAGGNFKKAGDVPASNIAAWNGTSWDTVGRATNAPDAGPSALTVYNGCLVAGGEFTTVGEFSTNRIASWDGACWRALSSGVNDSVYALTTYKDQLIAGGRFTTAGGNSANCIAAWNGSSWQALGNGVSTTGIYSSAYVYALTVYNDLLVAGGWFDTAGEASANSVAAWDGSTWQPLGNGLRGSVSALAVYNGQLVGAFTTTDWVRYIAAWDGTAWQALGGVNDAVYALAVYDGKLIAGGLFTTAGGVDAYHVAAWDGTSWEPIGQGVRFQVPALAVYNGLLVAAGILNQTEVDAKGYIAAWDGSAWRQLGSGLSGVPPAWGGDPFTYANALTVYNGDLVVSGSFTIAGGNASAYLARWGPPVKVPEIAQQPESQTDICPGATIQFTAGAKGTEPLTYKWQKDGSDLPEGGHYTGVNTRVLSVTIGGPNEVGEYRCVVSNDCGAVTSEPARLSLNPDTDSDGVADCLDNCPGSDLSTTIVIAGCDSGAPNKMLAGSGCKMSDEIANLTAGARNHGQFVSAVAELTDRWLNTGLITAADKGRIQSCAARSNKNISQERNAVP